MKRILVLAALSVLASTACGDDSASVEDTGESGDTDAETQPPYTVKVNGIEVPVHRVDRFETPVNFVRFDHLPGAIIEITTGTPFAAFQLSPERRGIAATQVGNTVTFALAEPEYLIFRPDLSERLLVLVDPPEVNPPQLGMPGVVNVMDHGADNTGATVTTSAIQAGIDAVARTNGTLYVPPGTYLTGELWMRSDMTLYLADGAVLKGSSNLGDIVTADATGSVVEQCLHAIVRMWGVTNSHIRGRGIIDANGTNLRVEDNPNTKYNLLKIEESRNSSVDGIIALDSSFWNTIVYRSDMVDITNYKVINNWLSTGWNETDGVDFDNATNSKLSNAFLYVGDDCMATKSDDIADDYLLPPGVDNYPADPTKAPYVAVNNVLHEDVVCFTNQAAAKVGTKTMGTEVSGITFRNIDVLNCGRALVIDCMDTANVHDIVFENIEIEDNKPCDAVNFLIRNGTDWRYSEGVGFIDQVFARDITIHAPDMRPMFRIEGRTEATVEPPVVYPIGAIDFTNVIVNGQHITDTASELIRFNTHAADNVTFH